MSSSLHIPEANLSVPERYHQLFIQAEALVAHEPDALANLANLCAILKESFGFLWVGFYRVKENELVLGPFQGPLACTRIAFGKGVCGSAWRDAKTMVVPDVELFPGHIACSTLSRSEIVVPVFNQAGEVMMVMDIDSEIVNYLDAEHATGLEKFAALAGFCLQLNSEQSL
jgi:L-methionine (R)-S-oxide reductase